MENMRKWKLFPPSLPRTIDKWNAILIGIRNQAKLGSDCVAFQQLLNIVLLIYFCSASIFLCFEEFSGSTKKSVVQIIGTFTLMNFSRIYCKIFYASQIAIEVSQISIRNSFEIYYIMLWHNHWQYEFQESNVVAAAKQLELGDEIISSEDKLKVIIINWILS